MSVLDFSKLVPESKRGRIAVRMAFQLATEERNPRLLRCPTCGHIVEPPGWREGDPREFAGPIRIVGFNLKRGGSLKQHLDLLRVTNEDRVITVLCRKCRFVTAFVWA